MTASNSMASPITMKKSRAVAPIPLEKTFIIAAESASPGSNEHFSRLNVIPFHGAKNSRASLPIEKSRQKNHR